MAGEAAGRTLGVRVFPCRVYPAGGTGRAGPPKQTPDVRSVLSGYRRYLAVDCGGSATPGRADWLFLHPALVGTNPQFSSPPALCRARWRHLPGRQPLGGLPSRLLRARESPVAPFPKTLPPLSGANLRGRQAAVLRRTAGTVGSQKLRPVFGAAP